MRNVLHGLFCTVPHFLRHLCLLSESTESNTNRYCKFLVQKCTSSQVYKNLFPHYISISRKKRILPISNYIRNTSVCIDHRNGEFVLLNVKSNLGNGIICSVMTSNKPEVHLYFIRKQNYLHVNFNYLTSNYVNHV